MPILQPPMDPYLRETFARIAGILEATVGLPRTRELLAPLEASLVLSREDCAILCRRDEPTLSYHNPWQSWVDDEAEKDAERRYTALLERLGTLAESYRRNHAGPWSPPRSVAVEVVPSQPATGDDEFPY